MSSVVLDASAILAVLHKETGHLKVVPHLNGGLVSAVNYAEVLKKAAERGRDLLVTRQLLQSVAIVVIPFDARQAVETAKLWEHARPLGLSFADRACLALSIVERAMLVTADTRIKEIELPVKVRLIRQAV